MEYHFVYKMYTYGSLYELSVYIRSLSKQNLIRIFCLNPEITILSYAICFEVWILWMIPSLRAHYIMLYR